MSATVASAVNLPYAKTPEDNKTYILVSRLKPASYLTRTGWDGALYLQGYNLDEQKKAAFTAQKNDDDTWCFYQVVTPTEEEGGEPYNQYVGIPLGSDNLNIKEWDAAKWTVEASDIKDYYLLKAGEGHSNDMIANGYLHLNNGGEYLVISEPAYGGGWFPDFYGGVERIEDEETGESEVVFDDFGFPIPLNPISRYWAFVEIDDVPAYSQKVQLYDLLTNIEENGLTDETFKTGFQGAYDAALVYYEKEEFTADDLAAAKAIIDGKNALYNEILTAQKLLGDQSDAKLTAAIEAAVNAFNTQSDAQALTDAVNALKDAEVAFAMGGDDLTALGQNMSFEDLTSQGGAQTSSVSAAPTGWNVYVNGKQVVTADEVRAAGITAWHGINNDSEGDPKEGELSFGIWNGGIPQYELSQTISGLENGTYTIEAGLMVGANGNGSRRTTQRIFGNLNSKYFATEEEYNTELLDQSEVYAFEGLEEVQTDRLLQPMSVRAFVYDGTLTFGVRTDGNIAAANRESNNSAGGDGWFKVDNFRITKEGYVQDDALAIYKHFSSLYDNLQGETMQKSIKDELKATTDGSIGSGSSQDEIIAAIIMLKDFYPTVEASVAAYQKFIDAINNGMEKLIEYENSASADEFGDLLDEAQGMYEDATVGTVEIDEMIAKINEGIEQLKATAVAIGDITFVLKNPSFEDLSAQDNMPSSGAVPAPAGWNLFVNGEPAETVGGGWCAINNGDDINVELEDGTIIEHQYTDGTHVWGIWNSNMPEVELSQTLKNMPQGTYEVEADVMIQYNWAGDNTTTQRLFGNNSVQMWGDEGAYSELNMPADALNAAQLTYAGYYCQPGLEGLDNSDLLHPMKVTFAVGEDGIAKIGFRTNGINAEGNTFATGGLNGQGWFKLDNFRLTYVSTDIADGIKEIVPASVGQSTYYGLDGRRLQTLGRGIVIMKTGDKAVKVVK